jgi:AmmeMemoRadiSam system protein A
LYEDIINNTLLAGFGDARFVPLKEAEIVDIKIEISILSEPQVYDCSKEELLKNIKANVHGIIVQQGFNQATYLPQVWQDLPEKELFLQSLCQKAGLEKNSWKNENTELFYYTVEKFSE